MTLITKPRKSEYVTLIRKYVNDEINEPTFGAAFQELHQRHEKLVDEKINSWPVRYDVQLQEAYMDAKIDKEEFHKKWNELWGETSARWREIVYSDLPYLFDQRTKNREVLEEYQNDPDEYKRTYFITEGQLKEELKRYLVELESSDD